MRRFLQLLAAGLLLRGLPAALVAQEPATPAVDSIAVEGNRRLTASQIIGTSGIIVRQPINYRDIQRAITSLFRTGQFDDVLVEQRNVGGRLILAIRVKERPVLEKWAVRGVNRLSEGDVKGRVHLTEGRPLDRNAVEQARAGIDSLYKDKGYYASQVKVLHLSQESGRLRVVFDIDEGERVAISQVVIDSNRHFSDQAVVKHMSSRPEGFWWFQKGEYDERKVEEDVREALPRWYADQGYVDFQVTHDSLVSDSTGGKAVLRLTVDEGSVYRVGAFDIQGSRRFSTEELMTFYPFGPIGPNGTPSGKPRPFSRSEWNEATEKVQNLYANNGYIYAQVQPEEFRRTTSVGSPLIDLRWTIREGSPATINKVEIVGNDVTHERVIREAIVMLPGDLFSRERLIRTWDSSSSHSRHPTCAPRQTASTSTSSSESRSAGRATSTSGPHWGRALVWAGFLGWKSPTSSGEASGASCSGSSGRTSMTLP
jgi:outer membrane protein insertion porin family